MRESYIDANGDRVELVLFYEHLNGYGMTYGYDFFALRGMIEVEGGEILSESWSHAKYVRHSNWDNAHPGSYTYLDLAGVTDGDISLFLYEVLHGQFEDVRETVGYGFYELSQAHLFIYMDDCTIAELRLFEGGYVMYAPLQWFCVKVPSDAFDLIFNAARR